MKNKHKRYKSLINIHNFRIKLVLEGIAIGLITGFVIVLYRLFLDQIEHLIKFVYSAIGTQKLIILPWILFSICLGWFLGILVKKLPMISGSGIPQVEGILLRKLDMSWWKVILGKFFGGALAIGSGMSLGREGPSIQIGASIGQGFSKTFKRTNIEEKYLITCGASAGLSAAFSAPLAGVMFALEEVHKNFSPLILVSAFFSSLVADVVGSSFFGLKPIFTFYNIHRIPLNLYWSLIILGVLLGILGVLFNLSLLNTKTLFKKMKFLPKQFRIIIPLMMAIVIGVLIPNLLGGGHHLITLLIEQKFTFKIILVYLIIKFIFTMFSYSSGAPGGIFLPLLAVGALIGNAYGLVIIRIMNIDDTYINNFIILAMAGYFCSVVRAPITGTILITEMTGSFTHFLPIAIVSMISYIVSYSLRSEPIYESLLERFMKNHEDLELKQKDNPKSILEYAISIGSEFEGKYLKNIELPNNCLIVSLKRGEKEIIPNGDTQILAGDYIFILTNKNNVGKVNDRFKFLTEHSLDKNNKIALL